MMKKEFGLIPFFREIKRLLDFKNSLCDNLKHSEDFRESLNIFLIKNEKQI